MIRITGLRKRYLLGKTSPGTLQEALKQRWKNPHASSDAAFYALDGVDLTVRRGEKLGIIGRNGAGKSTLLKILSRITAPTEGTVDLYGRVASMLEVGTGFHGDMTGRENVYLNGAILGMTRAEIDSKMEDIIRFSEIGPFIDTPVKRYSSGMIVKLGFAVAIHLDSEIILMDEVLAVGDIAFQKKCVDRLLDMTECDDRTVLFVSHNMNTIRQLCSRCVVLDKGRIVFDGDVDRAISVYLGSDQLLPSELIFNEAYRPNDTLIRMTKLFTIRQMKLKERMEPVYFSSEDAVLDLSCMAETDLSRVGFRFELWSQDGTKIASMLTAEFLDFARGESIVRMKLPLAHLVSGYYRADLVAFQFDGNGEEYMIDAVYPCFLFQVKPVLSRDNYLDWHHKYWGAIRLHDVIVELLPKDMRE